MNIRDYENKYERCHRLRLKNTSYLLILTNGEGIKEFICNCLVDFLLKSAPERYLVEAIPLLDNDGSFEGMQVIFYNEKTLLRTETEEQLLTLLESIPICCTLRDEDNNVITCNREAVRMFGVSSKDDVIRLFSTFYPEFQPDGTSSKEKLKKIFRNIVVHNYLQYEMMYRTASGESLPVESTAVKIPLGDGFRVAIYSRDMRNIRAKEEAIRQAEFASAAKSAFLANMSHEIRTPMNAILGMSELIRTDNLDSVQKDFFEDIRKMSKTLLKIINDILVFSKIEMKKMDLLPVHFNLPELIENMASISRFSAQGKDLDFDYLIEHGTPEIVFGDDIRIRQILTNVLNNAIKYTIQGSVELRIGPVIRGGKNYVFFSVRDTGIGIKDDDKPKIFSQFEQFDSHKNRDITGTGLGLPIVKFLTDMLDGIIEVESEYGKGSCFTVFLPLKQGDASQVTKTQVLKKIIADPSVKILVVDDNPINLKVANIYLSTHKIQAEFAGSGEEAVEFAKGKQYDLIFMDHMMPNMDGIETAAVIRNLDSVWYRDSPIVALTANAVEGTKELFFRGGMNDFISKPIEAKELNRILAKWLPADKLSFQDIETETRDSQDRKDQGNREQVLDRALGLTNALGDEKLYAQLLRDFIKVHSNDVEKIKSSWEAGDCLSACRLAHTMKSSSAIIGGKTLSNTALRAEEAFDENRKEDAENIAVIIRELAAAYTAFAAELSLYLSKSIKNDAVPDQDRILSFIEKLAPLLESNDSAVFGLRDEIVEVFFHLGKKERSCWIWWMYMNSPGLRWFFQK